MQSSDDLSYIIEALRPLAVPIDSVVLDPANAMGHPGENLEAIRGSLAKYGQRKPIVVNRNGNVIEAGNGTWKAAKALGWTHIAAVFVDDDPLTATGYAIADNRTAQLAEWDLETLRRTLDEGFGDPTEVPGIDEKFWNEVLIATGAEIDLPPGPAPQVDRAAELQKQWQVERGQIWEIPSISMPGRLHRLMCGDSTCAGDVERLMEDERAVLFATDPPYLVDYDGTNHPHKWNVPDKNKDWSDDYNDWDSSEQGEALYEGFISVALQLAIIKDAAWYCWHASKNQAMLERIWEKYGAFVHQQIIWAKDRPILTRSWYMWQHEPCFFGWVRGNKPKRTASDYPPTVWQVPTVAPGEPTDHPTSKPIELFAIPIRQHTFRGDLCYEPFSGSGSQFVAAEQLGRLVRGMEKNPRFVAVSLQRLADMGLEPSLVHTANE